MVTINNNLRAHVFSLSCVLFLFFFLFARCSAAFFLLRFAFFSCVDHSDRFLSFRKHFMLILVCILVALFYAKLALILTAVVAAAAAAADDDAALDSIKAIFSTSC